MSGRGSFDDDTPAEWLAVTEPPPDLRRASKYQPMFDWCDANPGQWARVRASSQYGVMWKKRGYETTVRTIDKITYVYVRRPA